MFTAATRASPVLAATRSSTVPFAEPFCPDAMVIQVAELVADHAQPVNVETPTVSAPPAAPIVSVDRLSVNRQGAAAWLTGTLCKPTAIAPDLAVGTRFAATVYATDAAPCPLGAPVTVTQATLGATAHVQSRAAAMVTVPVPPLAVNAEGAFVTLI